MGIRKGSSRTSKKWAENIGQSKSVKERKEGVPLPLSAALFFVAFSMNDLALPRIAIEYGPQGPLDPAYLPDLFRLILEESHRLAESANQQRGCLVLEGFARYETRGFPHAHVGVLRHGLQQSLHALLVDGSEQLQVVRLGEGDAEIRVSSGSANLVDKYFELWKGEAVDSSSGMWNQLLVPGSRPAEELRMSETAQAEACEPTDVDLSAVLQQIGDLNDRLTNVQKPLQREFQQLLDRLVGKSFGSLEANTAVADAIRFLLLRLEVRIECPREGCHEPTLIRCRPAGRTIHGSFEFEHRRESDGRLATHSASTRLPALKLVPAPLHRSRKSPN